MSIIPPSEYKDRIEKIIEMIENEIIGRSLADDEKSIIIWAVQQGIAIGLEEGIKAIKKL